MYLISSKSACCRNHNASLGCPALSSRSGSFGKSSPCKQLRQWHLFQLVCGDLRHTLCSQAPLAILANLPLAGPGEQSLFAVTAVLAVLACLLARSLARWLACWLACLLRALCCFVLSLTAHSACLPQKHNWSCRCAKPVTGESCWNCQCSHGHDYMQMLRVSLMI